MKAANVLETIGDRRTSHQSVVWRQGGSVGQVGTRPTRLRRSRIALPCR